MSAVVNAVPAVQNLTEVRSDMPAQSTRQPLSLTFRCTADVSREDSCRAISFCPRLSSLVVTSQNQQAMFRPYGFKKVTISCVSFWLQTLPILLEYLMFKVFFSLIHSVNDVAVQEKYKK